MRAVALISLVACAGTPRSPAPAVGQPLPAITLPLIDGGTWSSTTSHGALVIDVWATWCKPCSKGFPKLNALAARDSTVSVVAISIDEDPRAIRAFLASFPLTVPVAHDAKQTLSGGPLRIAHLPTVLIVDEHGTIRHRLDKPDEQQYDRLDELVAAIQ